MSNYLENVRYSSKQQNLMENSNLKDININYFENEIENNSIKVNNYNGLNDKKDSLIEVNQKLLAEIAFLETMNKNKDEKIKDLMEQNSSLKSATETLEELKMRINIYEQIDFPSILRNSENESAIKTEILGKIKTIEKDYAIEIIQLNSKIEELKSQIYNLNKNHSLKNNNKEDPDAYSSNNDFITKKDSEIMELKIKLARAEISIDLKTNQLKRLEDELGQMRNQINNLMLDNNTFNANSLQNQLNNNENYFSNYNQKNFIDINIFNELKSKYAEKEKGLQILQEELDNEKDKYVHILEMNQELGKKVIENIKIINDNKSEIVYLKKKVSDMQKEKSDSNITIYELNENTNSNNLELEENQNESKLRQQLEKANQELKLQIAQLNDQMNQLHDNTQTLSEELKLEKLENDNLKEIQKSDLKNISKILSENNSQKQQRKNEEIINELRFSLHNTNKINQELTNQKLNLEKEINDIRLKMREKKNSFMLISSDKEANNQYQTGLRDDKSLAAFSKYSLATNMTNTKFYDSKIKDLEESIVQEKENTENLLKIKQRIIEKLKKSNENLLADKNKLMRELAEEKMKNNSLALERNTLLESEEYFKKQIQELNMEIDDLRLYQDNYQLIEEKLEEFQKQFANLVNVYNNPNIQNEQYQKLVNENVELNAYKNKYFSIECEMQEKNKDILTLKDKLFYLERKVSMNNKTLNSSNTHQISNDININNININSISNNEKCANCNFLETNLVKFKQILDEYNMKISQYQTEVNELKNTIEDNRLVIFSLREKCKDMISKDKEILRLNTIINELNNRKKKKVSFGKEILVEYKKDNSPSDPVNERQVNQAEAKRKEDSAAYKLSDLLKSQEHLFEKYEKELDSLKNYRTFKIDRIEFDSNSNEQINNNYNDDLIDNVLNKYENFDTINNKKKNNALKEINSIPNLESLEGQSEGFYMKKDHNKISEEKDLLLQENIGNNYDDFKEEKQKEDSDSNFSSGKINIEAYKNLSTDLGFEFERIKNKYNLNNEDIENTNSYRSYDKNANPIFKNFMEKLNYASMSKSDIFSNNMFEKVEDTESKEENL